MSRLEQTRYISQHAAIRAGFQCAIKEAVASMGATAPNPSVGCVLLDRWGEIISVGVHPAVGQPHAEVMAVEAAKKAGLLERAYAALVTLEPCAHFGRTPPCSDLLRSIPVQEVWIGMRDPNRQAAGGGRFLASGADKKSVFFLEDMSDFHDLSQECAALLSPFRSRMLSGRPWITVKQALNKEGTMIPPLGHKTFTSFSSLRFAHQIRRATDAVITAVGTVLSDNPSFTVRYVQDHERTKERFLVVLDRQGRLPHRWVEERKRDGFSVHRCGALEEVPSLLGEWGVNWALLEAGPTFLASVLENDLWDDWLTVQQVEGQSDQLMIKARDNAETSISPLQLVRQYGENS